MQLRELLLAHGLRRALLGAGVVSAVVVPAYAGYWLTTRAPAPLAATAPTVVVSRGSLVTSFATSGTSFAAMESRLSFTTAAAATGGVVRSVDVQLGDQVAAGQALASLDPRSAQRAVEEATARLEAARISLAQLTAAAPADVAAAAQGVASASAALQRAQNGLTTLRRGSGADDVAAASQAVLAAQNALASAQTALDVLQGRARATTEAESVQRQLDANDAQLSAAEAGVATLVATSDAGRFVRPAVDDLVDAVEERCKDLGNREPCMEVALAARDLDALIEGLSSRTQSPRELRPLARSFANAAASLPSGDIRGLAFRELQALAARPGLRSRHESLIFTVTPYGSPSADDLLNANRTRDAARAALTAAQERYRELVDGPTTEDVANAEEATAAARAALDAALAAQTALGGGSATVAMQGQQVLLAEAGLRRAKDALDDTVLRAPFAGVVGAVDARLGDPATPGVALVTVIDPTTVGVRLTVSEAQVARLAPGQLGVARFDALLDRPYVVEVTGVGRVPRQAAGAATYEVRVRVLTGAALAARTAELGVLRQLLGLPPAATQADVNRAIEQLGQARPIPGMAATVTMVEQTLEGAVLLPVAAVRRAGGRTTVLVQPGDGSAVERRVVLGATDGASFEVRSGLAEGEVVVLDEPAASGGG